MTEINIKPLSVNKAWKGRRYKTNEYKNYESSVLCLLPNMSIPKNKDLSVFIEFGFSSKGSDIDNPVKMFLDILQKKYNFNDSSIYTLTLKKSIVEKGFEFIKFEII